MPGNTRVQSNDEPGKNWIVLTDFTAGIVQRPYGADLPGGGTVIGPNASYSITTPDKPSAQYSNNDFTFGCIANPAGGLQPLPLLIFGAGSTPDITTTLTAPNADTIDYFGTLSQMVDPDASFTSFGDAIYIVIQYVKSGGTMATTELRELFLNNASNNPFSDFDFTSTGSSKPYYYNGPMVYYTDDGMGSDIACLVYGSQNPSTGYSPGVAITPNTGGILAQIGTSVQGWFFSHQGRLLFVNQAPGPYNNANINVISFTDPPESDSLGTQQEIVVPTNFDDITCFGSISSGELLLLCRQYGGVIISGDIFSPIVTTVPGVQGTQSLSGPGLITPLGMVYLSGGSGAWAWNGGSAANKLSAQLVNNFFDVAADTLTFQLTQMDNWILFPNNWLYDMVTSSWWQLPPHPDYRYAYYAVVNFNSPVTSGLYGPALCALPATESTPPQYLSVMSYANGYSDWQWTSNPMVVSHGEVVDVREIVIAYTALITGALITVKAWGTDGTSLAQTFQTVEHDRTLPYAQNQQRMQFYMQTEAITIQVIVADASGFAVNVDSISIAYETRFHLATI
jgi:hypothetical protein